jgi:anti-sigma factor RsiW
MDCREFRKKHLEFVDQTLTDAEFVAMQAHLAECPCCARHDTALRRGLLIFRNLPPVEPSPDFISRLNARLHQVSRPDAHAAMYRGPGLGSFLAAAAGVVAAGFMALSLFNSTEPPGSLSLAPVVATRPALTPPPIVSSDFMASVSAGLPVWPAAMIAEQAPVHFASEEMEFATMER